ncbi:MAG: hypothetical protein HY071_06360 [Chloroflexi bacterium]|nr:hypothetical protein [Chloroflexota bacterium]
MSQVAFDRYVLELPPREGAWSALTDQACAKETAAWLWELGPTPLIAVVGHADPAPGWLERWEARRVVWLPDGSPLADAVVIADQQELARFLAAGDPHGHTVLLWPRRGLARTFEALEGVSTDLTATLEAQARVGADGGRVEVVQLPV